MKESPLAIRVIKYYDKMKSDRANWDLLWDEIATYIQVNDKNTVYGQQIKGGGEKKFNQLLDATGVHSNELLASALHSMLTNPTSFWFGVETGDPELDKDDDVKEWLQKLSMKMHKILNDSNFQTEIHEVYLDLGSYGTAVMRIEPDDEKIVRFQARPIFECYIAENNKGIVDTLYRCYKWSLRQIALEFGIDSLPEDLKKHVLARNEKQEDEYEVIHAVYPREKWDNEKGGPKKYKYASVYVLKDKKIVLSEGGFKSFPYVTPRWTKISGETLGRSPGMKALPDVKMCNKMQEVMIRSAQKIVDPPLQMEDDGVILPIRTAPGSLIFRRQGAQPVEPLETGARIDFGFEILNDVRQRIRSAFFIDQLQLNEGPQMTATEVLQRTEEKLRLLGPILGRQQFELLRPLLDRVYNIMVELGEIPEGIPDQLQGKNFQFHYTSQIVTAQKTSELENLNRALAIFAPIVQADPSSRHNLDADELIRYVSSTLRLPFEVIRKRDEVMEIRKKEEQLQQQIMEQQQAMAEAEQVQKVGPTLLKANEKQ